MVLIVRPMQQFSSVRGADGIVILLGNPSLRVTVLTFPGASGLL
jgi:hypothetical protein